MGGPVTLLGKPTRHEIALRRKARRRTAWILWNRQSGDLLGPFNTRRQARSAAKAAGTVGGPFTELRCVTRPMRSPVAPDYPVADETKTEAGAR